MPSPCYSFLSKLDSLQVVSPIHRQVLSGIAVLYRIFCQHGQQQEAGRQIDSWRQLINEKGQIVCPGNFGSSRQQNSLDRFLSRLLRMETKMLVTDLSRLLHRG